MLPESRTTVAILSGDPLIGRALELLLRGAGYEVRLLEEPDATRMEDLLQGVDVLLLDRGLSNGRREDFLDALASTLETATIPVLSLAPRSEGASAGEDRVVPWPSKIEDLAREIEAARREVRSGEPVEGSRPPAEEAGA
jgi:DNA-binding response OmpR family regulator